VVVVWGVCVGVEDGGGADVVVCVTVAVVTAEVEAGPPEVEVEVEVDVDVLCLGLRLALSGGTGPLDCGRATVACAPVPETLEASDPACAGADVDFTALPIPNPAAIAITSSTPSSHHRRSIVTSLHPVPPMIVVATSLGL
jgi:hypothetical protein